MIKDSIIKDKKKIDEKRRKLIKFCDQHKQCADCPLLVPELKCGRGQEFYPGNYRVPDKDVELAYSIAFPDAEEKSGLQEAMGKIQECGIKDSGARQEFDTGAVRDIQQGKGRCDLLPLDVIADVMAQEFGRNAAIKVLEDLQGFMESGQPGFLSLALADFMSTVDCPYTSWQHMLLEVSKHFEEGAKKYGEHNWQKGLPIQCYINSGLRHYLKYWNGDKDEPHDRAFCWNIMCAIWTCKHKPELNDFAKGGSGNGTN